MAAGNGYLRELVRRRAFERGWPRIRYEAATLYQIGPESADRSRVIRSALPTVDDRHGKPIVTVDSGAESWEAFLARADEPDLQRVNAALARFGPAVEGGRT